MLDINSPISNLPIKANVTCRINERVHKLKYGKSTAVFGFPFYDGAVAHSRAKGFHDRTIMEGFFR